MYLYGRSLSAHQVAVLLPGEVAGVEDLSASNLNEEHGRPQHVPRIVAGELDAVVFLLLVVVDLFNLLHTSDQIGFVEQHL